MAEITFSQKRILDLFSKSSLKDRFYWTGGTLLSLLYLHHRQSKDLDFFSDNPFDFEEIEPFINEVSKQLKLSEIEQNKIFDRWQFFLKNKDKVRIEFVCYEHQRIKPLKFWQGIPTDSLEDIATNKVMAVFDRNDPKDLVDLHFLLVKKKFRIRQLLKWVELKFGVTISEGNFWSECCKSLENLDEVSPLLLAESKSEKQKIIRQIKEYFVSQSADYLHKKLR